MSELNRITVLHVRLAARVRRLIAEVPVEALSALSAGDEWRLSVVKNAQKSFKRARGDIAPLGVLLIEACLLSSFEILSRLPLSAEGVAELAFIRLRFRSNPAKHGSLGPRRLATGLNPVSEVTVH
jgi:hypothetical protein